ncbi:MAG: dihydropyrimidinase [Gammaproteobacteria bacterium]|nr:dihydropyrimidinase [Gammaproteobacteria bacterium]MDH4315934.1 dihydropyrimidinase [Gammaproteobacteria bacterium]
MSNYDLKVCGGTVANAAETFQADVGIRDGRIVAIGKDIGGAKRVIDASGKLVLPGGIEAHCHIEQESSGGIMTSDDYYSGSVSAAFGGNTCFVPFAAQHRGQSLRKVLETYHGRAKPKSVIDYSFHLIISDPTDKVLHEELPEAIAQGITSFKVYMTYDKLIVDDSQMLDIFAVAKKHGALTMIHAENNAMIKWMSNKLVDSGHAAPKYHALSHPRSAESEAINRAIELAGFLDTPILIVHVSTEAGARIIAKARYQGHKVFGETCPQYMFLHADQMDLPDMHGAKFCCSPPLRDRASREEIWRCLQNGTFQVYSSDHAPYRFDETGKLHAGPRPDFRKIANGLPGIELRLPLLFSEGYMNGRITLNHFVALAAGNVSRIYGLDHRKGSITEGKDADIAIWDPGVTRIARAKDLHDNMEFTPYEGMEIRGWPTTVIRGGTVIVENNELKAKRGDGQFIARRTIDCTGMPGRLAPELDPTMNFGVDLGL